MAHVLYGLGSKTRNRIRESSILLPNAFGGCTNGLHHFIQSAMS